MASPYLTASRIHVVLAGLGGAGGVALLAAGSHGASLNPAHLVTAGQMLLFHAPLILAVTALRRLEVLPMRAGANALSLVILGLSLFCADLLARACVGAALFPMAAPIGGSLLICGWLALAAVGVLRVRD